MPVRFIALDIDGTLLDGASLLPEANRQAVEAAVAQGIDDDEEVFGRVDQAFSADRRCNVAAAAGEPGGEENGVGALRVELAPDAIADEAAVDLLAADESTGAQAGILLLPVG